VDAATVPDSSYEGKYDAKWHKKQSFFGKRRASFCLIGKRMAAKSSFSSFFFLFFSKSKQDYLRDNRQLSVSTVSTPFFFLADSESHPHPLGLLFD